ncbi:C-C motif chemokine 15 [Fukomys damarensis]|uniref:C-C motif chemokine n=1 Tax=Fukomys damarensis TaxID=885580 RepID=A0A091DV62_FUKDA|nr:C-C motif chemokine 15 [Fukomys damarensis]
MKMSMAALSFLILAAALGSQASITPESEIREHVEKLDQLKFPPVQHGLEENKSILRVVQFSGEDPERCLQMSSPSQEMLLPCWGPRWVPADTELNPGCHNPNDCCFSYTSRRIRCTFIEDYFETSGCPQPGVIFITKRGRRVCANPRDLGVQDCIININLTLLPKDLEIRNLA